MLDPRKVAKLIHPPDKGKVGEIADSITEDPDVFNEMWPFEKEWEPKLKTLEEIKKLIDKEERIIDDPKSMEVQRVRARKNREKLLADARRLSRSSQRP